MSIRKLFAAALAMLLLAVPALAGSLSVVTNAKTEAYPAGSDSGVSVPKGLSLKLTSYSGEWGEVSYKGAKAYIRLRYLDLKSPREAYLSKDATVYSGAGSGKLGTATKGTKVYFLGMDGDYARVTDSGRSRVAYVAQSALTTARPGDDDDESKIEKAIRIAQGLIGRPYTLVANPPESFNCAALVAYCYNHASSGAVKTSLNGQVRDDRYQTITDIDRLRRGDLVCFNFDGDDDNFGHVGIYLGGGRFIHASGSDMIVTTSSLSSGYYRRVFSWAKRIFS